MTRVCRVLGRQYPPQADSVAAARHWAQHAFRRWELGADAVADASLMTSELVTNAVLHARSPLAVSLAVADGVLEVGVSDSDPRAPRSPRRPTSSSGAALAGATDPSAAPSWLLAADQQEGGRGLLLVDQLADEWGVSSVQAGKQIWFRLALGAEGPSRGDCRCTDTRLGRVRLESGLQVRAQPGPWDDDFHGHDDSRGDGDSRGHGDSGGHGD